jgi:vWA-MoxR associated protein C-terminal domain
MYNDRAGVPQVGSGYIVRDRTVLTANHIANGTDHKIWCDGHEYDIDPDKTVRSGTNEVDLGVFHLLEPPAQMPQLTYAQVRRDGSLIRGFQAVGYPQWVVNRQLRQYANKQIEGYIRTAERMPAGGKADGQLLRLSIEWQESDPRPEVPEGPLADSPWFGMSGAVVTCCDNKVVIGVVHSHNYVQDPNSLTVTPLIALEQLSDKGIQRKFFDALGIEDINCLREITGAGLLEAPGGITLPSSGQRSTPIESRAAFSSAVRKAYEAELARAGLTAPGPWDYPAINQMYQECNQRYGENLRSAASPDSCAELGEALDTLEALRDAIKTLPVLRHVGLQRIGITKLQYLYYRHVGSPPASETGEEIATVEEMLIKAASVAVREGRPSEQDRSLSKSRNVTALARFVLGIASHWQARQVASDSSFDLDGLKNWVSEHLNVQSDDADEYLNDIEMRTWVIIEFAADESDTVDTRQWPTMIVVTTIPEAGDPSPPQRIPCTAQSEEALKAALHDIVNALVPEGDEVIVDLCMPRYWFDAAVEHWDVVRVDGKNMKMSEIYDPHLRWRMHGINRTLARQLRRRSDKVQWGADPDEISRQIAQDPSKFNKWLSDLDGREAYPPYFIGSSYNTADHDPLRELLRAGHGYIAWFSGNTANKIREKAMSAAAGLTEYERKNHMPKMIRENLAAEDLEKKDQPVIIWSNPHGREGFRWPALHLGAPQEGQQ